MRVAVFTPDEVQTMIAAYDAAFDCVEIDEGYCSPSQQKRVAHAIIEAARKGTASEHALTIAALLAANKREPEVRLHS